VTWKARTGAQQDEYVDDTLRVGAILAGADKIAQFLDTCPTGTTPASPGPDDDPERPHGQAATGGMTPSFSPDRRLGPEQLEDNRRPLSGPRPFAIGGRASATETLLKVTLGHCFCLPLRPGIGRAERGGRNCDLDLQFSTSSR